jgi:hypothetical protein
MLEFSPAVRSVVGQLETPLGEVGANIFRVSTVGEVRPRRLNFELVYKINSLFPVVFSAQVVWVTSDSVREFVIPYKPYMALGPWDLRVKILETNRRSYSDCQIDLSRGNIVIVDSISPAAVGELSLWNKEVNSSFNGGDGSTRSIVAARVGRRGGIIHSAFNQPVYIGFGAPPAETPNSILLKGSRIEIPIGFEGVIFCNFKGQQIPSATNQGPLLSVIEYVKDPA